MEFCQPYIGFITPVANLNLPFLTPVLFRDSGPQKNTSLPKKKTAKRKCHFTFLRFLRTFGILLTAYVEDLMSTELVRSKVHRVVCQLFSCYIYIYIRVFLGRKHNRNKGWKKNTHIFLVLEKLGALFDAWLMLWLRSNQFDLGVS